MKRFWLALLMLVLVPGVARATDTRVQSMGGKEKAWTVHDEVNALHLPATLLLFPNTIYADAGLSPGFAAGDADGSNIPYNVGFGTHLALGEDTVLAFYGSSLSMYLSGDLLAQRPFEAKGRWIFLQNPKYEDEFPKEDREGSRAIHNADHKGTLLFGRRMGTTRLGVALSYWGDTYTVDEPASAKLAKGATMFQGALGLGFDLSGQNSVDLAARFHAGNFTDDRTSMQEEGQPVEVTRFNSDTHWGGGLLARAVFDVAGGDKLVPFLDLGLAKGGFAWNDPQNDISDRFTTFELIAGTDLRIQPLEKVFIQPGMGLALLGASATETLGDSSEDIRDDLALLAPFVSASVDARVSDWFSVRFGTRQSVVLYQYGDEAKSGKESSVLSEYLLGSAFFLGNMEIDLMLNPALFLKGPSLFTGNSWGEDFAFQSAVRYQW